MNAKQRAQRKRVWLPEIRAAVAEITFMANTMGHSDADYWKIQTLSLEAMTFFELQNLRLRVLRQLPYIRRAFRNEPPISDNHPEETTHDDMIDVFKYNFNHGLPLIRPPGMVLTT